VAALYRAAYYAEVKPSHLPETTQATVRGLITEAAASLGIKNGVLKGDIVISDGRRYVIEMAARLSGGFFCTLEIPLNTGVDFVGQAIRLALGEPVDPADLVPRFQRPVVQRYLWPKPGRITAIHGLEEARAMPGVAEIVLSRRIGDIVPVPTASPASVAMVITTGPSRTETQARAEAAIAALRVETVAP
jgi:biotin carboxylase